MAEIIAKLDGGSYHSAICRRLWQLRGRYRIEIVQHRQRRSDRQNRYYHPCIKMPLARLMVESGQCDNLVEAAELAHEMIKEKFLKHHVECPNTGELVAVRGSTAKLDTAQFNEFIDRAAAWVTELGADVPDPSAYHEREVA